MNSKFYKIGIGISILLIGILITFFVLAKKSDKRSAELANDFPSVMSSTNGIEEQVATDTSTFNEISEDNKTKDQKEEKKKNESKTTNAGQKQNTVSKNETTNTTKVVEQKEEKAKEEAKDPVFVYPVEGEIIVDYAKDKLVYSNTLGEWITHLGVDIKAEKTTVVKSASDGTVKSIKNDPRYGLTVVIEHKNGFSTIYSNLLTAEFVNVGENVTSGQTIGTVGNTASFEILDESHLHFEILKNNEQIDPNMYLKN